jgi:hypothetical protein
MAVPIDPRSHQPIRDAQRIIVAGDVHLVSIAETLKIPGFYAVSRCRCPCESEP